LIKTFSLSDLEAEVLLLLSLLERNPTLKTWSASLAEKIRSFGAFSGTFLATGGEAA
jgi:hypothetical protein